MLGWSAQTTVIAMVLAAIAILASRSARLGPAARHMLWLVVLIKLITPPVVNWPWSPPKLWATAQPAATAPQVSSPQTVTEIQLLPQKDRHAQSDETPARPAVATPAPRFNWNFDLFRRGLFALWLGISATIAVWQIGRIVRFHRRLSWVVPAPEWLVEEVRDLSAQLGVRAPEILVLPDLAPPMLWFLGRAQLLLPAHLVSNADLLGLRAILAHELAHLRRGDHWVRRLDFFAGLIWWWNPVYWLTRERLSTEAELACDEWAIRAVPDGRVSYAEALLDVCRTLSTTKSPAPALGVAGAGRFLERRVNMILQNHAPSRLSVPVLVGACLLALLALPGWSAASSSVLTASDPSTPATKTEEHVSNADASTKVVLADDEDDDDKDTDAVKAQVAKELKEALGPGSDFQKEMKNLGEELKKELGPGSDFEKEMKNLGEVLKKELGPGSEFEKQMKTLGTDLEKQFGPGSAFEKGLELKGKAIEGKFGPGSDFEQKMNRLGKEMEAKFGEGSEFAKKMKHARADAKGAKASSDTSSDKKTKAKTKAEAKAKKKGHTGDAKARELKALKAQIDELNAQIKKLQEADNEENE
ncbi:MAG TPA: M56 family metallopeptidase [Planctomycetaceae bacterium]|jgi:beta-lactamase regulating signal transducer with metallopeptidase domain|nr:M56 family metallopeptidase [Planctomycetaceae bacterium]